MDHTQHCQREHQQQPWFTRHDLRLAVVTGLSAGIGLLSPIPYGYYLPLTTTAVLSKHLRQFIEARHSEATGLTHGCDYFDYLYTRA